VKAARSDGVTAWFEVGRGSPIVLIHGLADDHRAWRSVLPNLVLKHRVILYDLRGHGESDLGRGDGTLRQLSDDLIALLDVVGVDQAVLGGFSLGGTVAMRAAIDRPERVRGLSLIATSSRVGRAAAEWYAERAAMVEAGDPQLRAVLDQDTADVYRAAPDELEAGLLIRRQSTADPCGYANACRAMASLRAAPLDLELERIAVPTTILAGELDQHCPPRAAEIISAAIPRATVEILPGCGHALPLEAPGVVAAAIMAASDRS